MDRRMNRKPDPRWILTDKWMERVNKTPIQTFNHIYTPRKWRGLIMIKQ